MTKSVRHSEVTLQSRRQFLKLSVALGVAGGFSGILHSVAARAEGFPALTQPILVHIALDGGPDWRHLLPPAWNGTAGSYGQQYWQIRGRAHGAPGGGSAAQARWQNAYFPVSHGRTQFGIFRQCGFMKRLWDGGNLAIVNNVYGSASRDHQHAKLVMDQGNIAAGKASVGSGWGGRLARVAGGQAVALSRAARIFTFAPDASAPGDLSKLDKSQLIHLSNTRTASLFQPDPTQWQGPTQYVARSLKGYYAAKRPTLDASSPYFPFVQHEQKWRVLGESIDARLRGIPVPPALAGLATSGVWSNAYIGHQARNLYDALACQDILNMRVASLEFPGWDTHDNQASELEVRAEHLFGENGVLATLQASLPPATWSNLVFVLGGEFGRQLRDNGGRGTDHGVGTSMVLLGHRVRGGVYGDMFPEGELSRLNEPSPDITGLTAIDHVFGTACEAVAPGSKGTVFPTAASAPLEGGVLINSLIG